VALHGKQADEHGCRDRHHVGFSAGVMTSSPSIALSTEMAGVITLSP
jgi:hypothetical protein